MLTMPFKQDLSSSPVNTRDKSVKLFHALFLLISVCPCFDLKCFVHRQLIRRNLFAEISRMKRNRELDTYVNKTRQRISFVSYSWPTPHATNLCLSLMSQNLSFKFKQKTREEDKILGLVLLSHDLHDDWIKYLCLELCNEMRFKVSC